MMVAKIDNDPQVRGERNCHLVVKWEREREREREREEWWCHNGEIGLLWLRKRERAGSSGGGNNGGRERDERRSKGQKGRKRGGGEVLID